MERHPLIFLAIVLMLGIFSGTTVALLLVVHRQLAQHTTVLRGILSDLDALTDRQRT
jgi:hypothetical protein